MSYPNIQYVAFPFTPYEMKMYYTLLSKKPCDIKKSVLKYLDDENLHTKCNVYMKFMQKWKRNISFNTGVLAKEIARQEFVNCINRMSHPDLCKFVITEKLYNYLCFPYSSNIPFSSSFNTWKPSLKYGKCKDKGYSQILSQPPSSVSEVQITPCTLASTVCNCILSTPVSESCNVNSSLLLNDAKTVKKVSNVSQVLSSPSPSLPSHHPCIAECKKEEKQEQTALSETQVTSDRNNMEIKYGDQIAKLENNFRKDSQNITDCNTDVPVNETIDEEDELAEKEEEEAEKEKKEETEEIEQKSVEVFEKDSTINEQTKVDEENGEIMEKDLTIEQIKVNEDEEQIKVDVMVEQIKVEEKNKDQSVTEENLEDHLVIVHLEDSCGSISQGAKQTQCLMM